MSEPGALQVVVIPNGSFGQNTVLLIDEATRAAVVIDPGEEHARILSAIRHRKLQVQAIWLTHGHVDHIWGTDAIRTATGAEVWLHPADRPWYDRFADQCRHFGFAPTRPLNVPAAPIRPNVRFAVCGSKCSVMISQKPDPSIGPMPEICR